MHPIPEDRKDDWYDWCVLHWGTKWDISEVFISDDTKENSITFGFDTAWAPPVKVFLHWAKKNSRTTYRMAYIEPGMGFAGWNSYDGVAEGEEYVDYSDDSKRYWEIAKDEFGIEPEEDAEPLSEWYFDGVRDKGLSNE